MKISLQNIHHKFSKFIGLINLSNRNITIGNTFFSSESVKDHVENSLRAQKEKQEHFFVHCSQCQKSKMFSSCYFIVIGKKLAAI
jgi:hypothetical protein